MQSSKFYFSSAICFALVALTVAEKSSEIEARQLKDDLVSFVVTSIFTGQRWHAQVLYFNADIEVICSPSALGGVLTADQLWISTTNVVIYRGTPRIWIRGTNAFAETDTRPRKYRTSDYICDYTSTESI